MPDAALRGVLVALQDRLQNPRCCHEANRPRQTWKTFLRNHMEGVASIDLFMVPTIAFQQLFACLVLGQADPQPDGGVVGARQITEAFPWDTAPKYLIRDNDRPSAL